MPGTDFAVPRVRDPAPLGEFLLANPRKYQEDEVSEIFALAANSPDTLLPALADENGLTLEDLQQVGREVGLAPERVAEAAATVDARLEPLPRETWLGAPVSVSRVVELPRAATDREWEVLVGELRETFGVRGRVAGTGDLREWTSANLHAFLEPTETGHRLRLGSRKKVVGKGAVAGGAVGLAMCLFVFVMLDAGGPIRPAIAAFIASLFALVPSGALAGNLLGLRRWGDTRERQMEHIADRARSLLQAPPEGSEVELG